MTFLFDIGRVLLDFRFEPSLATLLPPGTSDAEERLARLLARKDEFEAGKIDVPIYVDWALEVMGSPASRAEFQTAWQRIFTPNEPMWQTVRQLAADGHRLILFSNTNAIHCPWIFEEYPELSLFEGAVLSHQTGAIKPQPEIYQYAISTYGLVPADTLYIDDLPDNIAAGRRFGFHCWQYDLHDHAAFESWLASHLNSPL
jgi:HAD superfamily hydrolase (TIGR01509 family)